jgi:6,7-dimethyl-8-ribityllumazine synthase
MKGIGIFSPSTKSINANYGIVYTSWNEHIVGSLLENTQKELISLGVSKNNITAKALASKNIDAIITLGAVIKGDTPHFDFIAASCTQGILNVSLEKEKPIIFGVLTTNTEEQALQRSDKNRDNKGAEFARSAMQMIEMLSGISE